MDDVLGILVVRQDWGTISMVDVDIAFIFVILVDPVPKFETVKSLFWTCMDVAKRLERIWRRAHFVSFSRDYVGSSGARHLFYIVE